MYFKSLRYQLVAQDLDGLYFRKGYNLLYKMCNEGLLTDWRCAREEIILAGCNY